MSSMLQQQSTLFDDPDGKIELPTCLRIDHWKRPSDFIKEKVFKSIQNLALPIQM